MHIRAILLALTGLAGIPGPTLAQIREFDGSWVSIDTTATVTSVDISGVSVSAFVRCGARRCSLGTTEAVAYNARAQRRVRSGTEPPPVELAATFRTAFRTFTLIVSAPRGEAISRTLRVAIYSQNNGGARGIRELAMFRPRMIPTSAPPVGEREHFPQLPLPMPRPSVRNVLPTGLATGGAGETLGVVFDRLEQALQRAEYPNWRVYAIGDDAFALVTQAERIRDDGRALEPERRWPQLLSASDPLTAASSLTDYLRRLFVGSPPGRYRVLVFAVTDRSLDVSTHAPDPAVMDSLLAGGGVFLPAVLRARVLGTDGRCEVFIYEFVRPSPDENARLVLPSAIVLDRHLAGAGLWTTEELRHE